MLFRDAGPADAAAVAELHAESWRRHYRGAYADDFLDGDVHADRLAAWTERLSAANPSRQTIVAEQPGAGPAGPLVAFVHIVFDDDPRWGTLIDNLHVAAGRQRGGIGARLLALAAEGVMARPRPDGVYLWVLEQNRDARAFYEARGAIFAGSAPVTPPGGVPSRLDGTPVKLRYAWPQAQVLLDRS